MMRAAPKIDGVASTLRGQVQCHCGRNASRGTYEVIGATLVLTSEFGVARITAGLGPPRRLAKRLLKNLCARAAAKDAAMVVADLASLRADQAGAANVGA